jgi:hypothetical protein
MIDIGLVFIEGGKEYEHSCIGQPVGHTGNDPPAIEPAQHTAAKVVRFLYLFQMATAILGNPMCAIN